MQEDFKLKTTYGEITVDPDWGAICTVDIEGESREVVQGKINLISNQDCGDELGPLPAPNYYACFLTPKKTSDGMWRSVGFYTVADPQDTSAQRDK